MNNKMTKIKKGSIEKEYTKTNRGLTIMKAHNNQIIETKLDEFTIETNDQYFGNVDAGHFDKKFYDFQEMPLVTLTMMTYIGQGYQIPMDYNLDPEEYMNRG